MVQRCRACGTYRFPATTFCPECQSNDTEWVQSAGRGHIFSWIVVRHPIPANAYKDEVPYTVALVTLVEGPRIVANIVDCPPGDIKPDLPVEVVFLPAAEGFKMPAFRPIHQE